MKTYINWLVAVLVLLALGTSCGGEPSLWVRLPDWPAGATTLSVTPWLDGVRQSELTIPQGRPGFVITLPEGTAGELRLQIAAQDPERCKIATADVTATLGPALRTTHEEEAQLTVLAGPICTLSLELPAGVSVSGSTPPGLLCPPGSARCEAEFPKGTPVTVDTQFDHHKYSEAAASGARCSAEGTCSIDLASSKSFRIELTARPDCSQYGFCPYVSPGSSNTLLSVWGSAADSVWAVGAAGTILHWDGRAWAAQKSGTPEVLLGVWGSASDNVWAVGAAGTILHWQGDRWTRAESSTGERLSGVWGSAADNVWAVGAAGTILRWNGSSWTTEASGTTEHLYGIWGSDANNVWVVGDNNMTVIRKDGAPWSARKNTPSYALYAVWGGDANNVWVVQRFGQIDKWDPKAMDSMGRLGAWKSQYIDRNPVSPDFYGVWVNSTSSVWVVGADGTILKGDGSGWIRQSSKTYQTELWGVWGSSANDIWIVGAAGTILRRKQ